MMLDAALASFARMLTTMFTLAAVTFTSTSASATLEAPANVDRIELIFESS